MKITKKIGIYKVSFECSLGKLIMLETALINHNSTLAKELALELKTECIKEKIKTDYWI